MENNSLKLEVDRLKLELQQLSSKLNSDEFSDRYRHYKKFVLVQKDSIPSVASAGELAVVNGMLLVSPSDDTWKQAGVRVQSVAAGTAAYAPDGADYLVQASTSGAQALTITLPEAANNLGLTLTFTFVTDGGQNITINRTGSDVIDETADTGNTAIALEDAGDTIQIMAVGNDKWFVIKNIGCTLT